MIRDPPAMHKPDNANSQQEETKYSLSSSVSANNGSARLCAQCGKVITERFLLKAMERFWHEDCLKCGCCDCRLGEVGSKLYYKADLMLCKRDYLRLFGATGNCVACNKVIPAFEMVMRAKSFVYHLECFACQQCNHRFCVGDRFYLCDNKILCEYDYEERLVFASMAANPSGLAHIRRQVSGLQAFATTADLSGRTLKVLSQRFMGWVATQGYPYGYGPRLGQPASENEPNSDLLAFLKRLPWEEKTKETQGCVGSELNKVIFAFTQSPSGGYAGGVSGCGGGAVAAGALVDKDGGGCVGADDASSGYGSPPDPDVCDAAR